MRRLLSVIAFVSVFGVALASTASAQQAVNFSIGGFLPTGNQLSSGTVTGRSTTDVLTENSDFLDFNFRDFRGATVGGEWLVGVGDKFDVGLGIGVLQQDGAVGLLRLRKRRRLRNRARPESPHRPVHGDGAFPAARASRFVRAVHRRGRRRVHVALQRKRPVSGDRQLDLPLDVHRQRQRDGTGDPRRHPRSDRQRRSPDSKCGGSRRTGTCRVTCSPINSAARSGSISAA